MDDPTAENPLKSHTKRGDKCTGSRYHNPSGVRPTTAAGYSKVTTQAKESYYKLNKGSTQSIECSASSNAALTSRGTDRVPVRNYQTRLKVNTPHLEEGMTRVNMKHVSNRNQTHTIKQQLPSCIHQYS